MRCGYAVSLEHRFYFFSVKLLGFMLLYTISMPFIAGICIFRCVKYVNYGAFIACKAPICACNANLQNNVTDKYNTHDTQTPGHITDNRVLLSL